MPLLLSVLLSFGAAGIYAYITYSLDRYEKEPALLLIGVFLWVAVVAIIGAIIAELVFQFGLFALTGSKAIAEFTTVSLFGPLVEETVKGFAVLLVFLAFRSEFDDILDGIVYAGVVALGFAATENALALFGFGYGKLGYVGLFTLFFIRVILGGWNHAFFTAFIGIGLAIARRSRGWPVRFAAPIGGWVVAVFFHSLNNALITLLGLGGLALSLLVDWTGWLVILGVIVWALLRERGWMKKYLFEEIEKETITSRQYLVATSLWRQTAARAAAMGSGRFRSTSRFYQLLGELAQKQEQHSQLGEESNAATINRLRSEVARLSPLVPA
jgi:RsiW-degrading membrane proteinase PrsW (M82 family)